MTTVMEIRQAEAPTVWGIQHPEPAQIRTREGVLLMADGYRLPVITWEPAGRAVATLIAVHAFGDFRMAFGETGPALARRGFRVHAYDQRGFGDTDGRGRGTATAAWCATCGP